MKFLLRMLASLTLKAQRMDMKDWIYAVLHPSALQEPLHVKAEILKQKRQHEFRRIEIK